MTSCFDNNISSCVQQGDCCGCSTCMFVCPRNAISLGEDKYGFAIPKIDEDLCIGCQLCLKICPSYQVKKNEVKKSYAALNRDESIKEACSSGGIVENIARQVILNKGVVYGACMLDNFLVEHMRIDSVNKLPLMRKSKYVQSSITNCITLLINDLKCNRKVLFIGTPCQVAAVKNMSKHINCDCLLTTIDLVCHGVPSQSMFSSYIDYLQKKEGLVKKYIFRAKRKHDTGMDCYIEYHTARKKKIQFWREDSYNYYFMTGKVYRESCYKCRYASLDRPGDITVCDFWQWGQFGLQFSENEYVSGVLLNTCVGIDIFKRVEETLLVEETSLTNIADNNGCLKKPTPIQKDREEILSMWKAHGYESIDKKYRNENKRAIIKAKIMRSIPVKLKKLYIGVRNRGNDNV
jgi:coenzyme F420-reducing hydrogenase beta subunit